MDKKIKSCEQGTTSLLEEVTIEYRDKVIVLKLRDLIDEEETYLDQVRQKVRDEVEKIKGEDPKNLSPEDKGKIDLLWHSILVTEAALHLGSKNSLYGEGWTGVDSSFYVEGPLCPKDGQVRKVEVSEVALKTLPYKMRAVIVNAILEFFLPQRVKGERKN